MIRSCGLFVLVIILIALLLYTIQNSNKFNVEYDEGMKEDLNVSDLTPADQALWSSPGKRCNVCRRNCESCEPIAEPPTDICEVCDETCPSCGAPAPGYSPTCPTCPTCPSPPECTTPPSPAPTEAPAPAPTEAPAPAPESLCSKCKRKCKSCRNLYGCVDGKCVRSPSGTHKTKEDCIEGDNECSWEDNPGTRYVCMHMEGEGFKCIPITTAQADKMGIATYDSWGTCNSASNKCGPGGGEGFICNAPICTQTGSNKKVKEYCGRTSPTSCGVHINQSANSLTCNDYCETQGMRCKAGWDQTENSDQSFGDRGSPACYINIDDNFSKGNWRAPAPNGLGCGINFKKDIQQYYNDYACDCECTDSGWERPKERWVCKDVGEGWETECARVPAHVSDDDSLLQSYKVYDSAPSCHAECMEGEEEGEDPGTERFKFNCKTRNNECVLDDKGVYRHKSECSPHCVETNRIVVGDGQEIPDGWAAGGFKNMKGEWLKLGNTINKITGVKSLFWSDRKHTNNSSGYWGILNTDFDAGTNEFAIINLKEDKSDSSNFNSNWQEWDASAFEYLVDNGNAEPETERISNSQIWDNSQFEDKFKWMLVTHPNFPRAGGWDEGTVIVNKATGNVLQIWAKRSAAEPLILNVNVDELDFSNVGSTSQAEFILNNNPQTALMGRFDEDFL